MSNTVRKQDSELQEMIISWGEQQAPFPVAPKNQKSQILNMVANN